MRRLVASVVGSCLVSTVVVVVFHWDATQHAMWGSWQPPGVGVGLVLGVIYSFIVNFLFFFIRRWDGCIEKLGGFSFMMVVLLSSVVPFGVLKYQLPPESVLKVQPVFFVLFVQIVAIGFVCTAMLRTSSYRAPKPGEPLEW